MPTKPEIKTFSNASVDILNAIRNNASTNYRDYVPVATNDTNQIRGIGAILADNPNLQNEFLTALVNRIAKVIVKNKLYQNPWKIFKQGILEYGETIEEIFVDIAEPFQYDPAVAEKKIFSRNNPKVKTFFHAMNFQKFYKATINSNQLKMAFTSINGVTDLISKIVQAMYTGANYDEFLTMKYMLARHLLNGRILPISIPSVNKENAEDIVTTIKSVSNDMIFAKTDYNIAGVTNNTEKEHQYLITNAKFDASINVSVLAQAFNMDKAEFTGHKILVDSFAPSDLKRLDILFDGDGTYKQITPEENKILGEIPAILCSKDWFMIFDNMIKITEQYNGEGLYWNYWLHVWKTFSISPFENAVAFVPGIPKVTSIEVTPKTATIGVGQSLSLNCVVKTEQFAPQTVKWSVNNDKAKISQSGVLTAISTGSVTVTVTSIFDELKTATATITIQ